jgi:uncharacterized membrane-anchored protein YitT (DUF2179 family)
MSDFFARMLNAKDQTVSSSVFLTVITSLTVLYVWGFVSIWARTIQDIPTGVYTFVGIVILGKVGNTFVNKPELNTTTTQPEKEAIKQR